MTSQFRIIKSLEWCPELPSTDCPRKTHVFTVNGNELFFRLALEISGAYWYYNLYAEVTCKNTKFEPCRFKLQVGFKKEETLTLGQKTCELSKACKKEIWCCGVETLKSKLPADYLLGNGIKFLFCFDDTTGHILKINERNDKRVASESHLNINVSMESLFKDFSELLDSGPNHDAEIKCGEFSMKAHKIILGARSEVFKAMLQSDMLEGRTGVVEIRDMDAHDIQDFVKYLYTGSMPEMTFDKAKALYEAGDKYAVRCLVLRCSKYLQNNLSPEIACECLELADAHSDQELKSRVTTYILDEKLYLRDELWLPFCENHPRLANEQYRLSYKANQNL